MRGKPGFEYKPFCFEGRVGKFGFEFAGKFDCFEYGFEFELQNGPAAAEELFELSPFKFENLVVLFPPIKFEREKVEFGFEEVTF